MCTRDAGDVHEPADRPEGRGRERDLELHVHAEPPRHRSTRHRMVRGQSRHHAERSDGKKMYFNCANCAKNAYLGCSTICVLGGTNNFKKTIIQFGVNCSENRRPRNKSFNYALTIHLFMRRFSYMLRTHMALLSEQSTPLYPQESLEDSSPPRAPPLLTPPICLTSTYAALSVYFFTRSPCTLPYWTDFVPRTHFKVSYRTDALCYRSLASHLPNE